MQQPKPKRQKHNYTSELELKSLLIRSKNKRLQGNPEKTPENTKINRMINRYVKTYVKLNNMNYPKLSLELQKRKKLKVYMKQRIITLSEQVFIDYNSNERFGAVILLMIKSILTKPNFSGYTYQTEFYSDAISKILKYLHNFDHTLISKISNTHVNSFAYISQIIHNSIIFVINKKKKEQNNINKQVSNEILQNNLSIADHRKELNSSILDDIYPELGFEKEVTKEHHINKDQDLIQSIKDILAEAELADNNVKQIIHYDKDMKISMEQYNDLQPLLKSVSIIRDVEPEPEPEPESTEPVDPFDEVN